MNRIERQARWNGALVHWFHGPPVALLSYPPHWFHRIGHAGCKTLFHSRRVMGSRWTVLFLTQKSNENLYCVKLLPMKRVVDCGKRKKIKFLTKKFKFLSDYHIFGKRKWLAKFRKSISRRQRLFRIDRNNDQQRYPIFRPFVEMFLFPECTRTRGVTPAPLCLDVFPTKLYQYFFRFSRVVWREIYAIYSFHPSNIVFIVPNRPR